MLAEVGAQALEERLLPHVRHQLAQHRGALGVGDAVEVGLHRLQVHHVGHDRVGGGQLVLVVRPGLLGDREGGPRVAPAGALGAGEGGGVLGEGLVQPQVVPPAHGHQVAEPHVRQLVQDRQVAALADRVGDVRAEHVGLHVGDRARVLHRAHVVLRHEHLVVLGEGEVAVEGLLVEVDAGTGHVDHVLRVHVLGQRRPGIHAHGDGAAVAGAPAALTALVVAGDQRHQVGGDPLGGLEAPGGDGVVGRIAARIDRLGLGGGGDGDDPPVRRGRHGEGEGGLQVGLLEAGEHAAGIGDLELGVQVHLVVHRVHEAVQALTGVHVDAVGQDPHGVRTLGQRRELHAGTVEAGGGVGEQLAVELDLVDLLRDQVHEGLPCLARGEAQRGLGQERLRSLGEIQADVVGVGGEEGGAFARLGTGEVLG